MQLSKQELDKISESVVRSQAEQFFIVLEWMKEYWKEGASIKDFAEKPPLNKEGFMAMGAVVGVNWNNHARYLNKISGLSNDILQSLGQELLRTRKGLKVLGEYNHAVSDEMAEDYTNLMVAKSSERFVRYLGGFISVLEYILREEFPVSRIEEKKARTIVLPDRLEDLCCQVMAKEVWV